MERRVGPPLLGQNKGSQGPRRPPNHDAASLRPDLPASSLREKRVIPRVADSGGPRGPSATVPPHIGKNQSSVGVGNASAGGGSLKASAGVANQMSGQKTAVSNVSSGGASGATASSTNKSNTNGNISNERPSVPTEEELLRGCGFQAIWSENFEFSQLTSAALKMCRLSPLEEQEWQECQQGIALLFELCKGRLGRHSCLLQSRLDDAEDVLSMEEEGEKQIHLYQKGISTALEELHLVKRMQRQREEIESLCGEVLKRPCLKETRQLENAQVERREKAERAVREARGAIARKKQLVEAAIEASKDLLQEPGTKS